MIKYRICSVILRRYQNIAQQKVKMLFLGFNWISRIFIFTSFSIAISIGHSHTSDSTIFTDQWAVHVIGGDSVADAIAAKHGFINLGKVYISQLLEFTLMLLYSSQCIYTVDFRRLLSFPTSQGCQKINALKF